jgi:hypothetical protein
MQDGTVTSMAHAVDPASNLAAQSAHVEQIIGELRWLEAKRGEPGLHLSRDRGQRLPEIGHAIAVREHGAGPGDQFQRPGVPSGGAQRAGQPRQLGRGWPAELVEPAALPDQAVQHPAVQGGPAQP